MRIRLDQISDLVMKASQMTERLDSPTDSRHPFEMRGFSLVFPDKVRSLFDDGHYAEASFTASKYFDKFVQGHAKSADFGKSLMMQAFNESKPVIQIVDSISDKTSQCQQEGFKFLCAGSTLFIRNPRGHEVEMAEDLEDCLAYLSIFAALISELNKAGFM